jgi:DNA-binding beta-propeller fold protein YncE
MAMLVGRAPVFENNALVYGQNEKRYRLDRDWVKETPSTLPVNDCHEMVQDYKGRIALLTNETRNNVIFFDKSGKALATWGKEFPGAHGLSLHGQGKDQTLLITDTERNQVFRTTLDGRLLKTWDFPAESGVYQEKKQFVPTETAALPNGEFYVADGYGAQYILHYDAEGRLKNVFGGRGEGDKHLENAHGICVDHRGDVPLLVITDRMRCCFKRFTLAGEYIDTIPLPGACVCRPVIQGDYLYAAVLRSPNIGVENSGFVIVLNKQNQVVSVICGSEVERDASGQLRPFRQTIPLFQHPHDVMVDDEENLYVCQWASGKVYPYRFTPV